MRRLDRKSIIADYKKGNSMSELMRKYKASKGRIHSCLWKGDVEVRDRKTATKLKWKQKKADPHYLSKHSKRKERGGPIILNIDGKNILEHHKVWLDYWSLSKLPDGCIIHHIDHNQSNNKIENLICVYELDHKRHHSHNTI